MVYNSSTGDTQGVLWRNGQPSLLGGDRVASLNASGWALAPPAKVYLPDGGTVALGSATWQPNGFLNCTALGPGDVIYCQRQPADGGVSTLVRLEPAVAGP
jgi:hypothetical protein